VGVTRNFWDGNEKKRNRKTKKGRKRGERKHKNGSPVGKECPEREEGKTTQKKKEENQMPHIRRKTGDAGVLLEEWYQKNKAIRVDREKRTEANVEGVNGVRKKSQSKQKNLYHGGEEKKAPRQK